MSGKKSSEVAAVLKQGESVRKMTDGIYSREIENCRDSYLTCLSAERQIKNNALNLEITLSAAASEMFADKARNIVENFSAVRNEVTNFSDRDESKKFIDDLKRLDNELATADRTAEDIRQAIRTKDWYCDEEYKQAQQLVKTYKNLRQSRATLETKMKNLLTVERQKFSSMQAAENRLKNLQAQIVSINEVANKRKEADSFRNELQENFSKINVADAKKFFAQEFSALQKNISDTVALSDDGVLSAFRKVYEDTNGFKEKLVNRVALWHKQKKDAEDLFKQMEHVAAETLIGPVDYYNDGENGAKIGLFDYLKTYGGKDFGAEYSSKRNKISELMQSENFVESMELIKSTIDFVENVRSEGLQLQEMLNKKTALAGAIQDVMEDLKYDTELEIINDNPKDGFRLTCTVGDEIIDFTHIDIDDEGKIIAEIDHKESAGGNCANSWSDISRQLNNVGIPLTKVSMANGVDVLHRGGKTQSTSAQVRTVSH